MSIIAASIDDVAQAANVSTATVSRAMRGLPRVNEGTRARILAVAEELGYVPSPSASGLASGRTRTIGVLAPYLDRWYFGRAIEGLELELRGHAYTLMLFGLSSTEDRRGLLFNRNMVRKQIAGLVVLCLSLNPEELDQLHRTEIPLIAVGGAVHGLASIRIDDAQAAADATNHLISLGHRDIAQLRGSVEEDSLFTVPGLRSGAFAATMAAAGLPVREQWNVSGEYNVDSGVRAAQTLFDSRGPRPTAVFCGSDEMALGLMLEAHRRGIRVPQDVSVIGIDDHDFAQAAGLTTIRQDPSAQGRLAAKLLLGEIAGRKDVSDVVAPHELVVRSTTAPPR